MKILYRRDRFKEPSGKEASAIYDPIVSREDNIRIYRDARISQSKDCPNLPLTLLVEITSRCNLHCKMCNIHHDTRSGVTMSDVLLGKTFDLARTATMIHPFGLGEALLDPRITGAVAKYKSLGASVGFVSNGMLLSEQISEGLIRGGLDHLTISIDAADPLLFSAIRRGADLTKITAHIKALNHLKETLHSQSPALALSVVVQASNFYQLPQIMRLAGQYAVTSVAFHPITVHKHIPEIQNETLGPGLAHWKETLEICRREGELRGITLDMQRLFYVLEESAPDEVYRNVMPCPEPFRFMGIRANGDVFPCCNWDVNQPISTLPRSADITVSDLKDAWRNQDWRSLRGLVIAGKYPEQCRECMRNFTRPFHDEHLAGQ